MKILIGVPTHKRPALLRACLESIAAQSGVAADVQVFVADNDPLDRSGIDVAQKLAPAFRFPLTGKIIEERGISAVRNAILDEARRVGADFIAMIDDDETASGNWLADLSRVQQATGADAVGGPVEYMFNPPPPSIVAHSQIFATSSKPEGPTDLLDASGNFMVSASALKRAGWPKFDLGFGLTGGGDTEWFTQLSTIGFRFAWAPNAIVRETVPPERTTTKWVVLRAFRGGNSSMRIWFRHRSAAFNTLTLGKSAVWLALAPLTAPALLHPVWRARLVMRWCRAAGKVTALFGGSYREYAGRHKAGK